MSQRTSTNRLSTIVCDRSLFAEAPSFDKGYSPPQPGQATLALAFLLATKCFLLAAEEEPDRPARRSHATRDSHTWQVADVWSARRPDWRER
jgi:hypothetical protein